MKLYLSENNTQTHHTSHKTELQRIKSKLIKNASKNKNPQNQFIVKNTNIHSSVSNRSKSTKKQDNPQQIIVKLYKQHVRTHTDSQVHTKSQEIKPESELNKTYSKNRLKTETSNCNAETLRVIKKEKKPIQNEDNFIANIVKERLNQQKKSKRVQNPSIKKIMDLVAMAKNNKNAIQPQIKPTMRQMEGTFSKLYDEMQKQQLSQREDMLCELVQVLMKKIKHSEVDESQRLLRVVRELQQRNVRLMNLVNYMKRKGVDVDFFWNSSNLS